MLTSDGWSDVKQKENEQLTAAFLRWKKGTFWGQEWQLLTPSIPDSKCGSRLGSTGLCSDLTINIVINIDRTSCFQVNRLTQIPGVDLWFPGMGGGDNLLFSQSFLKTAWKWGGGGPKFVYVDLPLCRCTKIGNVMASKFIIYTCDNIAGIVHVDPPTPRKWKLSEILALWLFSFRIPPPPENWNLGRSWHFVTFQFQNTPPPQNENCQRSWHFDFSVSE